MTEDELREGMMKLAAQENRRVPGYTNGTWMNPEEIKRKAAKGAETRRQNNLIHRRERAVRTLYESGQTVEQIAEALRVPVKLVEADLANTA